MMPRSLNSLLVAVPLILEKTMVAGLAPKPANHLVQEEELSQRKALTLKEISSADLTQGLRVCHRWTAGDLAPPNLVDFL